MSVSPTRHCQRWPQNPSNRCELFDVQQPPETHRGAFDNTVWTNAGALLVTFDRTFPVPTSSAENRIGYAQNLVGAAPAGLHRLRRTSCAAPAPEVPHRLCRAGCTPAAVPRRLRRASWVGICGVAAAAAARTHQVLCHSVRFPGVKRATVTNHTGDGERHHKRCGLLTELRRISGIPPET